MTTLEVVPKNCAVAANCTLKFGDRVLREIAQGMKGVVRETDTVARIGGDEFGIVLWGQTGEAVADISQRLSRAVATIGLEHSLDIGLSIGAATLPRTRTLLRCSLRPTAGCTRPRHRTSLLQSGEMPMATAAASIRDSGRQSFVSSSSSP